MQIAKNVANSKLLVDATKQAVKDLDEKGSKYQVQFSVQTPVIKGLTETQVSTFLGKCRQALGHFKDDLNLANIGVVVEKEVAEIAELQEEYGTKVAPFTAKIAEHNKALVEKTHLTIVNKLGLQKDDSEAEKAS